MHWFAKVLTLAFVVTKAKALTLECLPDPDINTCLVANLKVDRKNDIVNSARPINKLHAYDQKISYIPLNLATHFPHLSSLIIQRCGLKEVSRKNFKGFMNLTILSFWNNQLSMLDEDTFYDLTILQELNLKDNQLKKIEKKTFSKLRNLKVLILDSNDLKEVDVELFSRNEQIEVLSIKDNYLSSLPNYLFESLKKLKILHLDNNEIKGLQDPLFTNTQLRELTVADNSIESIGKGNHLMVDKLVIYDFLYNPCTENLTSAHTLNELKESCMANEATQINWLDNEIQEIKRLKRGSEENLNCLRDELMQTQENLTGNLTELMIQITRNTNEIANIPNKILNSIQVEVVKINQIINNDVKDEIHKTDSKIQDLDSFTRSELSELPLKIKTQVEKALADFHKCNSFKIIYEFLKSVNNFIQASKNSEFFNELDNIKDAVQNQKADFQVTFSDKFNDSEEFEEAKKKLISDLRENCKLTLTIE